MGNGGAARAGCMGFSLVGILVSVGLVVWLGSRAYDGVTPTRSSNPQSSLSAAYAAPAADLGVIVDPATGLTGDSSVTVWATGLDPGEKVMVVACVAALETIGGGGSTCDPSTEVKTTASPAGKVEARVAVPRVVRADGLPFDCATGAGLCEVQVHGTESTSVGRAPVSFSEGLDQPELADLLAE